MTKKSTSKASSRRVSSSTDDDIVMIDMEGNEESRPKSTRRSTKNILLVDSDDEPPRQTPSSGTKLMFHAVEVPKKQTKLDNYFSSLQVRDPPPTSKVQKGRVSKDGSDDEEEYQPEESEEEEQEFEAIPSEDEVEASEEVDESEEEKPKKGKGKGKAAVKTEQAAGGKPKKESYKCVPKPCGMEIEPRDGDQPPMSNLEMIFDDIISRVPLVKSLMGPEKYRKLRVATMCSGTESPLLALKLFARAIKNRGYGHLEIEHVFSCEIEPYKQAYIERNFRPPILFRDIRELGEEYATTAYGAKVKVPGDVDMLIAGTSCVDFSNLNNSQKGIEAGGESGDTFLGMMAWVKNHRPLIVIQENVHGAAWAEMRHYYHSHNYAAEYTYFDSKFYYIPHTRSRGYLFAADNEKFGGGMTDKPNKWIDAVKLMKRPSTTTFEAFMLPDDDPRVYKARMQLAGDSRSGPVKARTVDWERCEGRHQRERVTAKIGTKRLVTNWEEGGVCKLLDFMWQDWGQKQVDRVLDLMDINYLLSAKDGYDPMYKAGFWNLSQNVDRNTMGGKPMGICPCLTPHMIPFLTDRGGPMTGIETLHMQGLPIDELLLTRETSQQIQDLAGNAMSSTVVGTCMLMALVLCRKVLPVSSRSDMMDLDEAEEGALPHIIGEDELVKKPLDLSTTAKLDIGNLLAEAQKSSRLCICEGRSAIATNKIRHCTECGFTVCDKCGGRPSHVVPQDQINPQFDNRLSPLEFELKIKSALPMRLAIATITQKTLDNFKTSHSEVFDSINSKDWKLWCELVLAAVGGEFRFQALRRHEKWTVAYESPAARLELVLNPKRPEWRVFGICPADAGLKSRKRKLSEIQIMRMLIQDGAEVLDGEWELCFPSKYTFDLSVKGMGNKIPTWKRELGMQLPEVLEAEVWERIHFEVPAEAHEKLDRDISGEYKLLPNCGTAQGALHIKVDNQNQAPLFFFIDQTRIDTGDDCFVFADDKRRLAYGETRPLIAKLPPSWRQFSEGGIQKTQCTIGGHWVHLKGLEMAPPAIENGTEQGIVARPGSHGLIFDAATDGCKAAHAILLCQVPLKDQAEVVWPRGKWADIELIHERKTFDSLAWLTERIRSMPELKTWTGIELPENLGNCERCAPTPPALKWVFVKNKFRAVEDAQEAAPYERALKAIPKPIVTQLHLDEDGVGTFKIGLNIASLVHRALARFPPAIPGRTLTPTLSWRLVTDYIPESRLLLPKYELGSNKRDRGNTQPPNFIKKLRPEQLRSLTWMIQQECRDVMPFIEEEVSEALLPHMNWRVEGKAERPNVVRGGVLADEVGYGKTAISIGLIDCTQIDIELPKHMDGAIPVKATIICVPGHLLNQWPSEVRKFTGSKYNVVEIKNMSQLGKLTVKEILKADIVLVGSGLFKSDAYLKNLAGFAGSRQAPASEGRRFFDWQKASLSDLAAQVDRLQNDGASEARNHIEQAGRRLEKEEASEAFIQKKRAIGAAYVAEKEKPGDKRKRTPDNSSDDTGGEDSDASTGSRSKKKRIDRVGADPWKLKSGAVRVNWQNMQSPPLEMFHFNRVIVDEFTYLTGQVHAGITSLKANSRWVLSGTPPLDDFADVKTIAVFLNIHLGIDDEMEATRKNEKLIKKDRTGVEQFTSFREVRSPYWHGRRQEVAQAFLNQFVRQNYAEIDEIPYEEHLVSISLPAAERAIYLELEHYLQALDYNMRRSRAKSDNDRDRRQQEALGDSKTAEEALIKRCSHFDLDLSRDDEENAVQACDVIVEDRKRQLASCREDIRRSLRDALKRYNEIPQGEWEDMGRKDLFMEQIVRLPRTTGVGDPAANHDIRVLLDEAFAHAKGKFFKVVYVDGIVANPTISEEVKVVKKPKKKGRKDDDGPIEVPWPKEIPEKIEQLKQKVFYIRALIMKELTGRHRSLRYFTIVRDLQKTGLRKASQNNERTDMDCQICGKKNLLVSEAAVLSSCGHVGCYACLDAKARKAECITDCAAATRALAVVRADSLGTEDKKDGIGRHYGQKLEKVMELIRKKIPKEEKVLLFVQFPDLLEKVAKVLTEYGVKFSQVKGAMAAQGKIIEEFQTSTADKVKVLLLNVMQESSAGANLTVANHAIMLSPLLTESEYEYKSSETQAIGRVRRYGQEKKVHVWRFLTEDTMDVEIFEKRSGRKREDWREDEMYRF